MNKKEKIKELMDAVTNINKKEFKERFGEADLYSKVYEGLESIDELDFNYMENLKKIKGKNFNEKMANLQNFTLEETFTMLTAILRYDRFVEGLFKSVVESGDVLSLLTHAYAIS